ncbi:hypothetical protein BC834DRAFT_841366 [Gloeopeniophorella convolvens]|nr:hypothetical protein BC834DRAFT_841366 [Gloeopeniophorella convolvens]
MNATTSTVTATHGPAVIPGPPALAFLPNVWHFWFLASMGSAPVMRAFHVASQPQPTKDDVAFEQRLGEPDVTAALLVLSSLVSFAAALGGSAVYRRYFQRIRSAGFVTPDHVARKRWIRGVVTTVGDADNFRLYHTPAFGWRGPFKFRRVPTTTRELKDETIHIRMAGADAPEASHFGNEAQPFSAEALAWLHERVAGRTVRCQILKYDQYGRIVARPIVAARRWWPWPRYCVPLEMVREGWAAVYEGVGAVYGEEGKEAYLAAQAEAQAARRGIWQKGTSIETPAEYKKRHRAVAEAKLEMEEAEPEPEPTLLERILPSAILPSRKARKQN